ncbi:protein kinase [Pseudenhygromyxa sp. WMMC2535]|uniref:serine/threonine-protein kinase n=1 Tax=Pseudenhygromyxa sp. WMMC2535 TaxID=2712867 RepID=UPI001554B484|nr:serine/threonine-protein kinase [Pseudenhygromyxa sp. WMMC2535]NVB40920.1 protein kinase [Pseudenhygromyxa sp. WMMC2535]
MDRRDTSELELDANEPDANELTDTRGADAPQPDERALDADEVDADEQTNELDELTIPDEIPRADALAADFFELRLSMDMEANRLENEIANQIFGFAPQPTRLGRYTILERLGEGGMGVVYSAYDPQLDRRVALKLLRQRGQSERDRQRLRREALALARVNHPNVVTVHEVTEIDEQLVVAMEFVVGSTLAAWIEDSPRGWREILEVYRQAARGLVAAHEAGLVHRDFKPANAIYGEDGRVRVVDFGLARSQREVVLDDHGEDPPAPANLPEYPEGLVPRTQDLDVPFSASTLPRAKSAPLPTQLTRPGAIAGTPAYMSPEQCQGAPLGPASDQFSYCVSLYEALYGARPFAGRSLGELSEQMLAGDLREPPRSARVPSWIFAVLRRGLATDPGARYPSMDALLAELDRDPVRRRRRWLVGVGLVALAGLSGAMLSTLGDRDAAVCEGGEAQIASVWDEARNEALSQHLLGLDLSYAPTMTQTIVETLDDYAARWVEMHREACQVHLRAEQSDQLYDKRLACLARSKAALGGAVEVLTDADETLLSRANDVLRTLPPLQRCADVEALEAEHPPPSDPELARQVAEAREELARIQALAAAGKFEADPESEALLERARALGFEPLIAEVMLLRAKTLVGLSISFKDASILLREAAHLALANGDNAVAAEAMIQRIYTETQLGGRSFSEAEDYALIRALLRSTPNPEPLRAMLANNSGSVAMSQQDYEKARQYYERALESMENAPSTTQLDMLRIRTSLAFLDPDPKTQVAEFERITASYQELLGPTHPKSLESAVTLGHIHDDPLAGIALLRETCPRLAENEDKQESSSADLCYYSLATVEEITGEPDRALTDFVRSVELMGEIDPSPIFQLNYASAQGSVLMLRGEYNDAIELLANTRDFVLASEDAPSWLKPRIADTRLLLGRTLLAAGQYTAAIEELRASLEAFNSLAKAPDHEFMAMRIAQTKRYLATALIETCDASAAMNVELDELDELDEIDELLISAHTWFRGHGPGYVEQARALNALRRDFDAKCSR